MQSLDAISLMLSEQSCKEKDGLHVISMPQVILSDINETLYTCARDTYCSPTRLKVKSAMRTDSVEPLIEGVPVHDAA